MELGDTQCIIIIIIIIIIESTIAGDMEMWCTDCTHRRTKLSTDLWRK